MAVASVSGSDWHKLLPSQSFSSGAHSQPQTGSLYARDSLHLSSQAKLISDQLKKDTETQKDEPKKDYVQVSSSIGRSKRMTGLSHDEALALYRSIEAMA